MRLRHPNGIAMTCRPITSARSSTRRRVSLDLVVIDGHYRTHVIAAAIPKIARGRWLLVDDVQFWPDPSVLPIPRDWARVDDSSNGLKRAIIWRSPRA